MFGVKGMRGRWGGRRLCWWGSLGEGGRDFGVLGLRWGELGAMWFFWGGGVIFNVGGSLYIFLYRIYAAENVN